MDSIAKANEYKMVSVLLEIGGKKSSWAIGVLLTPLLGNFELEFGKFL